MCSRTPRSPLRPSSTISAHRCTGAPRGLLRSTPGSSRAISGTSGRFASFSHRPRATRVRPSVTRAHAAVITATPDHRENATVATVTIQGLRTGRSIVHGHGCTGQRGCSVSRCFAQRGATADTSKRGSTDEHDSGVDSRAAQHSSGPRDRASRLIRTTERAWEASARGEVPGHSRARLTAAASPGGGPPRPRRLRQG
jgi:hypothetical protein